MKVVILMCAVFLTGTLLTDATVVHGQGFLLSVDPGTGVNGNEVSDGTSFTLPVTLDNDSSDVQGWSYGICHDMALLSLDAVVAGSTTSTVNNGGSADFAELNMEAGGYTIGVVISFTGAAVLAPGSDYELTVGTYTAMAGVVPGDPSVLTEVTPCQTLGVPPVSTVVVVGGSSLAPQTSPLTLAISPIPPPRDFVRGDANADGHVDISDGIWMLSNLFQGGPGIDCDLANDANADGSFDTADAIYDLNYVFLGGAAPSAPFPGCGQLENQTIEQCQEFPGCP